jgi:hypothetical protein
MCSYPPTVTAGDCTSTSTTNSCRFARSATNASSAEPSPEEALKSPLGGSSSLPPCQASPAGGATSSLAGAATGNRCRRSARRSGPLVAEKRLDALPTEDLTRLATAASVIPASRASSIAPGPPMHSAEAGTPAVRRRKRQRRRPETASSRNGPRPYSWAVPFHCAGVTGVLRRPRRLGEAPRYYTALSTASASVRARAGGRSSRRSGRAASGDGTAS